MEQGYYCWVPCKIENAGFDSERKFEVDLRGDGRVVGTAYIKHFRDENRHELPDGHPPYGQAVKGFVHCRVVRRVGESLVVEFPGTDTFHVPEQALSGCWGK